MIIAGARPNFMKVAPLMRAFQSYPYSNPILVHTGQHYDDNMSRLFFEELQIPKPEINLGVGSASHAQQTAAIMTGIEPVMLSCKPDVVVVVGDVNSTVGCGLVAVKLGIRLAHVEAGLRSHDRSMPEEINRILTDAMSDLLFCSEPSGIENLQRENVESKKVHLVGNVMIDSLLYCRKQAAKSLVLERHGLEQKGYGILTLHRPSNVDDNRVFSRIVEALEEIQRDMPIVFPVHPRTRACIQETYLGDRIKAMSQIMMVDPFGYMDFMKLMSSAYVVLTDSGGIQEETTILGIPCLTLRENTERPATVDMGTNQIVGTDAQRIVAAFKAIKRRNKLPETMPPLWDGHAAERIADIIIEDSSVAKQNYSLMRSA
ncbi:non-hydrolyzing UDP-N-acetylglucosamine 2-epimerase [Planctomycetota bacterium]